MTEEKPIRFRCPKCSVQMRASETDSGKQRRCPKCQTRFRIPSSKASAAAGNDSKKTPAKKRKREEQLAPVVCGVCSTRIYAKLEQVGSTVECPDCFTQNMVKPPPKGKVITAPVEDSSGSYGLAPAENMVVAKTMRQDLLQEADEIVQEEIEAAPKMPDKPFFSGIFSYPFRLRILPIVLSMAMAWTFWVLFTSFAWSLQGFAAAVAPFLLAMAGIFFAIVLMPSLVTFQKIMENSANGDDEADVRPEGGLFAMVEWFGDVIPLIIAASISCVPTVGPVAALGLDVPYQVAASYFAYLLFPLVFLSMLENASIMGVVSGTVWKSLGKVPGSWMKFFLIATLLFPGIAGSVYWLCQQNGKEISTLTIFLKAGTIAVTLCLATIYFRLLGRLAFVMTQKVWTRQPKEPDSSEEIASASV